MSDTDKRTFLEPHKLVRDEDTGFSKVDPKQSESFILLEAFGQPRVFYAQRANRYFKDAEATKEYTNKELEDLNLPTPVAISAARKKLIAELVEAGSDISHEEIYHATSPSLLRPRADIDKRLYQPSYEETVINKLNRATLGK